MAGIKGLVSLAFMGSIGAMFVLLACAYPQHKVWWPLFVVLFYLLSPLPTLIARRHTTPGESSSCMDVAIFITTGLLISSFALPIVLARVATIQWSACFLTMAGNVVIYLTILGFFTIFNSNESDYFSW